MIRTAFALLTDLLGLLRAAFRSRAHLAAENLFLRKQLASYVERQVRPRRTDNATRVALVAGETLACDFFVVLTATFRVVSVFLVLDIGTRRMLHWNVTDHPTAEWTVQQFRSVLTGEDPYQFIVHDRDAVFSPAGR